MDKLAYNSAGPRQSKNANHRASAYARKQSPSLEDIKSWADTMQALNNQNSKAQPARHSIIEQYDYEVDGDMPKMHLVPCRWEKSGWKYVQVDPKEHNFFNN